jgi:Response regulator receiver domain.
MREVLEASGHRVAELTNGGEALDLIHRDPPDVAFPDLQMPYATVSVWSAKLRSQPFPPPGRFGAPRSRHWLI